MGWVDGSPITFAAFMETAPFQITGSGNNSNTCVMALYDGNAYFWMNNVCSDQYPAICRVKGEQFQLITLAGLAALAPPPPLQCPWPHHPDPTTTAC
jgi:hypothetical protein